MKKIPTLFVRDRSTGLVTPVVTPGCEWVAAGEGVPFAKFDGTAVEILDGAPWKRYELRPGKTAPAAFRPMQDVDPVTGKQAGWVPATETEPADQWIFEALRSYPGGHPPDGTYELCGPKIPPSRNARQNPHDFPRHVLVPHTAVPLHTWPREFGAIVETFVQWSSFEVAINGVGRRVVHATIEAFGQGKHGTRFPFEGIVFHHPDGRRAKVKRSDFGLPWAPAEVRR